MGAEGVRTVRHQRRAADATLAEDRGSEMKDQVGGPFGGPPASRWPDGSDGIPAKSDDPPGWHIREKTDEGYPLVGSSPAERAEAAERLARIRRRDMRDHPFVGDGPYCEDLGPMLWSGTPTTGMVTMRVQCGWSRDTHPVPRENVPAGGPRGGPPAPVDALVQHLVECRKVDAAVVSDGEADDLVAKMLADGWTYEGVEYVGGKRVRYLMAPSETTKQQVGGPPAGPPAGARD